MLAEYKSRMQYAAPKSKLDGESAVYNINDYDNDWDKFLTKLSYSAKRRG